MSHRIYLIIIAILLVYIIFMQQCRAPEVITEPGEVVTVVERDTITFPPDTIYVEGPSRIISIPVPSPHLEDTLRTYRQAYSDSLLRGTFQVRTSGYLHDWSFEYIPRFPHIHHRQVQIVYRMSAIPTLVRSRQTPHLLLGAEFSGNLDRQSISGQAGIDRRNYIYLARYDPFQKEYGLSIVRKFGF